MRLLLITPDRCFGNAFLQALQQHGHVVDWFEQTRSIAPLLDSLLYQCLVLDMAADGNGASQLLDHALRRLPGLGTVVVAAGADVEARIALLDRGVDDVLAKPVDLFEATARVRRAARRMLEKAAPEAELKVGPLRVATGRREVRWFDRPVLLTKKEYGLLEVFLHSRGRVLSRARLEDALYGMDTEIASNAVEVHIHHLRRKLAPEVIVSVRSVGYQLGPVLNHG